MHFIPPCSWKKWLQMLHWHRNSHFWNILNVNIMSLWLKLPPTKTEEKVIELELKDFSSRRIMLIFRGLPFPAHKFTGTFQPIWKSMTLLSLLMMKTHIVPLRSRFVDYFPFLSFFDPSGMWAWAGRVYICSQFLEVRWSKRSCQYQRSLM